ncbi:hypothetical protein LTR70_010294 [Exophiala xenobiotica]|uniref:Uncharacterized protein n=1 Tax=Lithohypha guttulata TaxID=1690604 RepID=A0ABR0JUR5_9EURO|nr:hypothetical protein LTR24_010279 [Lithohypha guttulata]KAK5309435.1 hypothetical protein LTR70_010294 [Exophiala xenobiotica]
MHLLEQGERLRSFIRTAIETPRTTIDSIAVDLDDYPSPLRTVVVTTGKAVQRPDGSLENYTASAPCGLDLLVKASAQAQAVGSGPHLASVTESKNNAVQRPVRGRGTEPENVSLTASPAVYPADASVSPSPPSRPLSLVTEAQEGTTASTEEIRSDAEENVLRLFPTKAQYLDFASLLARAKELGAESIGVFKMVLPEDMPQDFEVVDSDDCPVSVFAATKKREGVFLLS